MMRQVLFSLCLMGLALAQAQAQDVRQVLDKMYAAMSNAKVYSYDMHSKERLNGKYFERKMFTKINEKPKKIYMKNIDDGVEILYVDGWNSNKAFINPNGFPWTNVSLDLNNSRVRADGHHIMTRAGFEFTLQLMKKIEKEIALKGESITQYFSLKGTSNMLGKNCYRLCIDYPTYQIITHKVVKTQEVGELALELNVPEYKILELNKLTYGDKVKVGQTIKVPNAYAKQVVFYVDTQTYLPIVQMLYDEQDLYEKYEYRNLMLNPKLSPNEWTTQCAGYGF